MKQENSDRELISNPNRWPRWPILPLKHRTERDKTGLLKLACLFEGGGGKLKIAVGTNMFTLNDPSIKWIDTNVDEILAQGWKVD